MKQIEVEGARTHNLKSVRCRVPQGALTVVTGVSGSGKSSLAFDTIYAEGQRRYVDAMSTYARQFLERMERPDVDRLDGVPPGIAIGQSNGVRNARSTVGTATEISDYLRLLYARVGDVHCPSCGVRVVAQTAEGATDATIAFGRGARVQIVAPLAKEHLAIETLLADGHRRLLVDGEVVELETAPIKSLAKLARIPVLIDRTTSQESERTRIADALRAAFSLSRGRADVFVEGHDAALLFGEGYWCASCDLKVRSPEPAHFSYNSPLGACDACQGFGRIVGVDYDKVIPDARKTLAGGAISIFQMPSNAECQDDLMKMCKKRGIRTDVPWQKLPAKDKRFILDGEPDYKVGGWKKGQWYGVKGLFRYLESKKYKMHVRVLLARYRGYTPCEACEGSRLRKEARAVLIGGASIAALEAMPIGRVRPHLLAARESWSRQQKDTARPIFAQLESRLAYLEEVGLSYLMLIRQTRTLSGGEAQRIALASALGAQLTGTMYVLDEPSVGLHARDTQRLLSVLQKLAARGNTVLVVEHEVELMRAADHIIDLGPGAGAHGGSISFEGTYSQLVASKTSRTAEYLRARDALLSLRGPEIEPEREQIVITAARAHNLKNVDVRFPMQALSVVTGVSGSGKSTLIEDVLYKNAMRARGIAVEELGACDGIAGLEHFGEILLVDQSPLARSSRSNPATYLKAMDELRALFADTQEAEALGLTAASFSFNVAKEKGGGRCETCQGQGTVTLEMHFLADVTVVCDACSGARFSERVLRVRVHGLNIKECLDLTVTEALLVFSESPKLVARLWPFAEVGLGYLTLGQSTSTLSGGEAQRLKLAAHLPSLRDKKVAPKLFLLDEPTTGLHGLDVAVLVDVLRRLVSAGNTVIAIEHNLDFISAADWIVDLGPEGGEGGGEIVSMGSPGSPLGASRDKKGRNAKSAHRDRVRGVARSERV